MSLARAQTLHEAAMRAVTVPLHYARTGGNLAWAALAGASQFVEYEHHPRRDVVDAQHQSRFFYHAHPVEGGFAGDKTLEHGHFHVFVQSAHGFHHLAGLSLTAQGMPLRWFTTNRWVTGERWRPASAWGHDLKRFEVTTRSRLAPVARWVTAMVQLYADDLQELLRKRDQKLQQLREQTAQTRAQIFEDRRWHVFSHMPIDLQNKVQTLL